MGPTGSGKSTVRFLAVFWVVVESHELIMRPSDLGTVTQFINLVSGSDLEIGYGLRSCTDAVNPAGAFNLDGRRVVLIDTPGFDDTTRSDTDVLKMIAAYLATS
jgi:hypothetical protein